jgi:hypothetical protein
LTHPEIGDVWAYLDYLPCDIAARHERQSWPVLILSLDRQQIGKNSVKQLQYESKPVPKPE